MERPHRVADKILDGLVDAAKDMGETVSKAMDEPPKAVEGPEGIHRIPGRVLDSYGDSLKTLGEGVAKALDHPVEQFGVPPELPKAPKAPKFR